MWEKGVLLTAIYLLLHMGKVDARKLLRYHSGSNLIIIMTIITVVFTLQSKLWEVLGSCRFSYNNNGKLIGHTTFFGSTYFNASKNNELNKNILFF